ncbi:D-alanyl-D-alanine dipeptidase [Salmonella enterica]|nr:D-alanyl-D-alanine dipeptidase [Salmonella enterica]EJX0404139.1 D-alanyl-D-alanine dipeptidase [Salmonella enterica]EJX0409117.1 D-alanyl-D-alanine dipeptidase [Salmonella enterica]EJX0413154.1 D-alanyl-D-alanine dipeptidase [Salmonella enterica]
MKKFNREVHEKTTSWSILRSERLKKCGRLLLLLLYRFIIGWAFFQLLVIITAGILLLGVLLFHPVIFVQTIAITEKLNHASIDLWNILKLCLLHYGVIAGFIFMLGCAISKSIRQAQRLSRKFGA